MSELKPCKVCNHSREDTFGLAVPSLAQLKARGCETLGFRADAPVSVVLEEDGTIVEDEAYFLCLPPNTKFMLLHDKDRWSAKTKVDGGTAWLKQESVELASDCVDSKVPGAEPWHELAVRLSHDLAGVILMSEEELQTLVDVPSSDLATALGFQVDKVRMLQEALQGALDRREEQRQAKELLQLYLKSVEQEGSQAPSRGDVTDSVERPADGTSTFSARTLMVLKGKTSPETRLSNQELQMVVNVGVASVASALGWSSERSAALVATCEEELKSRLDVVQAARSLSNRSQNPPGGGVQVKRRK
ncbi:DNA fragmentation factor subunit alpha isoform X2 [Paramormyrops kingsleyae]|uniref:DNA fragmentation factor subunit alpha isoform X2 n=1 Tax=Paramormyrops kingsleyae TaxID=1676925 RepID=UPI000CD63BA4|nr:DNA fragmentation factor subunit alpha isoform X2 [Paramormyrops kingsleyae]